MSDLISMDELIFIENSSLSCMLDILNISHKNLGGRIIGQFNHFNNSGQNIS